MSTYIRLPKVIERIEHALKHKRAFSLVRVGDGENIVLAQNSVWTIKKVMREPWAKKSRRGKKGVSLPNAKIRNEIVRSIQEATIVGILPENDRMIKAPQYLKRSLTNQVFRYFKLRPKLICHACVNRKIVRKREFWKILKGKRVLIMNSNPGHLRSKLTRRPYNLKITATIRFSDYKQMSRALKRAAALKNEFDIALISCGVNAVVLAPRIAELTGKVAIDFGKAPRYIK